MFTLEETAAAAELLGYGVTIQQDDAAGALAVTLDVSETRRYGTFVSIADPSSASESARPEVERANVEAVLAGLNNLLAQAGVEMAVAAMAERILDDQQPLG